LGIFEVGSLELFVLGWPQTMVLLISASWVVKITGISHQHLALFHFLSGLFKFWCSVFELLIYSGCQSLVGY
jgi:hypothetical protein